MTKSVAILGCGPAGLLVAHAANINGWDFRIYSRKQKSKLYGAQYLHNEIPKLDCGEPHTVNYTLVGSVEQYRVKVYGDDPFWDQKVSPEDLAETHDAWDIRKAYDKLWQFYHWEICAAAITKDHIGPAKMSSLLEHFDEVVSTIPRTIWADEQDTYSVQAVWALGDTERQRVTDRPAPFTVVCNGADLPDWYRVSNIFGFCTKEWTIDKGTWSDAGWIPPHPGASLVQKPLKCNIRAASDMHHLGRYGAWRKGVLTSDAFYDAMKIFEFDGAW